MADFTCEGCGCPSDSIAIVDAPRGFSHHSFCQVSCWQDWVEAGKIGQHAVRMVGGVEVPVVEKQSPWTRFWRAVVRAMWGNE